MRPPKHPDAEPAPLTLDHIRRALDTDVHGVTLAEGQAWPESPGVGIDWREACEWLVGECDRLTARGKRGKRTGGEG